MKHKNLKILSLITGGLILISGFLLLTLSNTNLQIHSNITNNALAYNDKTTHPDLVRETVSFYELSTGKKFTEEQKQWVIQGSIDEDLAPRWLNHFYDPVYERGLTTDIPGVNGYLAKNWAQFSSYQTINIGNIINLWTGNGPVISGSEWGDFSYEAAVKNYSKNKEKEAYIALGHVLHLIEDMTVPEHTRNDAHTGGTMASFYESWTMSNSSGLTQDLGKILFNQGRKTVIYSDLASYFNNLADYTNTHFFSPRTIKSDIYQKPKIVFEDGTFAYGYDENSELFDLARIDKFGDRKWINDIQVLQGYWLRLSRQAVINGTGAIQLFLNQAEAAKQIELAKQKVDENGSKSGQSLVGFITNLFTNPNSESNQPALTINSEAQPVQPKINSVAVQPKTESQPKAGPPLAEKPNPSPITPIPITTPTLTPMPSLKPTPAPTPAPVVVYGGGGGGGSSTNTTPSSSETASDSTSQSLNVQTFNAGDLVINEIMYDLGGDLGDTDTNREWIEIYNNSSFEIDLTGWKFNDGDDATNHGLNVPPDHGSQGSMILPSGGYTVLAENAQVFLTDHPGFSGTVIDTAEMNLKNASSTVTTLKIIASNGTTIDEVTYYNSWGANGDGKTLERKSAVGGSNDPNNWGVSSINGGTPGAANNWLSETATSTEPLIALGTDVPATTTISTDTTWTLAGSPYRLFFNSLNHPTVAPGAILTIAPGAKIIPQGGGFTALEIKGTLNAIATSGAPIIFTSIVDADNATSTMPQKGDWLNIVFSQGSQGNLDYVEFRYGGQGITSPLYEMVNIVGATININHSKFENSQNTALHLVDSSGIVENSIFSDNICGISVDSSNGVANTNYGGCYGIHTTGQVLSSLALQIRNNQFIRNQNIGVEFRSGTAPIVDNNVFTDNGIPLKIESSYPTITNSQITNSIPSPPVGGSGQATSTFLGGIAISGYTHFSQNYTLKKDLPYILETNGPDLSPYIDSGATLILEPGVILKSNPIYSAIYVNGGLIASSTPDNPIIFTSFKDDLRGGDTNGDGSASSPQDSDWANIKFLAGSIGNFVNTIFNYGGYGFIPHNLSPTNTLAKDFPVVAVSGNSPSATSSQWIAEHSYNFNKIIIHKFSTANPQNLSYKIGIKDFRNDFIAATELSNLQNISESELIVTVQGQFSAGEEYYAAIETNDSFSVGQDADGKLAMAFYELVPGAPAHPMLSIDAGATVVIQ